MISDDEVKSWVIARLSDDSKTVTRSQMKLLRLFLGNNLLKFKCHSLVPLKIEDLNLDSYLVQHSVCCSTIPSIGEKVVYTGMNGYLCDHDNDLIIGQEYIIRDYEVDHSSTKVWLVGFDGYSNSFNGVIFAKPEDYQEWVQEHLR